MWKLSTFDMNYLLNILNNQDFIKKTIKTTNKNLSHLKFCLKKFSFIEDIYESDANFLLIKLKGIKASKLQMHLKKYKIMIRDCSNFDFLDDSFVRIAVKDKKNIKVLNKALKELELVL